MHVECVRVSEHTRVCMQEEFPPSLSLHACLCNAGTSPEVPILSRLFVVFDIPSRLSTFTHKTVTVKLHSHKLRMVFSDARTSSSIA